MKKISKKCMAICLITVLFASGIPKGTQLSEVQATGDTKNKYTYLSFHDYGQEYYDEEVPQNPSGEFSAATIRVKTMDKVVFSGKVTFHEWGTSESNRLSIGGTKVTTTGETSDFSRHGIGLYASNGKLYLTNYYIGKSGDIPICEVNLGNPITFSFQFDKIESGIWKITYCVNDVKGVKTYTNLYPNGQNYTYDFGTYLLIQPSSAGAMSIESIVGGENETVYRQPMSYDLADGAYLVTGTTVVKDETGETVLTTPCEQPEIHTPGDYTITTMSGSFPYVQNVSLYKVGDVNTDGTAWTAEDSAMLESMISGVTYKFTANNSKEKGADINNDGKVGTNDLALMKAVVSGSQNSSDVLKQYHVKSVSYDYLGGDGVMPIVGYYGPYYGPRENGKSYNFINDKTFALIKESGINLINFSTHIMGDVLEPGISPANYQEVYQLLELAEKYEIGYYVEDYTLNPERPLDVRRNRVAASNVSYGDYSVLSLSELAKQIGKYSYFDSYLGVYVQDEPEPNKYTTSDGLGIYNRQLQFFDWTAQTMNQYTNSIGFINLFGPGSSHHVTSLEDTFGQLDAIDAKLFSYDYYPFAWSCERSDDGYSWFTYDTDFDRYYEGLWASWNASKNYSKPFWAYVEAGGDFRDDVSESPTNASKQPTDIETYWNVNNYLAFGAKGIEWFTLLQPWWFSLDASDAVDGVDADRNGLIGIDGEKTPFYNQAQTINKHIAAIDDVLMKSTSKGVYATGDYTVKNLKSGNNSNLITDLSAKTNSLQSVSVSGSDNYGAVVGCFDYRDTEAFYVVNDDMHNNEADSTITLNFKKTCNYRYVSEAKEHTGSGSTLALTVGPGEGVLVVLNEDDDILYTDEANEALKVLATDMVADGKNITFLTDRTKSLYGNSEQNNIGFVYHTDAVFLNESAIRPTITEVSKNGVWGFQLDMSNITISEGDIIQFKGTIYPTSGEERGRLTEVITNYYVWTNGAWSELPDGYYGVELYKGERAISAYPEMEGMLFAGWYTDDTCKTVFTDTAGIAYAKFVNAGVMANLAQVPVDVNYDTGETKMRFVSTVDSLYYSEVGFKIQVEGSAKGARDVVSKDVYQTIVATEGDVPFNKEPADIHKDSKWFFTYTLTGITNELFGRKIYVTPFWITLDGTIVYGECMAKTVNMGISIHKGENNNYNDDDVINGGLDGDEAGLGGFIEIEDPETGYGSIS